MALSPKIINKIITKKILVSELSNLDLVEFCELANSSYRAGEPIVSDYDYNFIYLKALKDRHPKHQLLHNVEPEGKGFSDEKFLLPEVMLSMDKAYSWGEVVKWLEKIKRAADNIKLPAVNIKIKASAKLDGFAGFDDGKRLYTRGDGKKGSDISRVFARGLTVYNDSARGQGAGEIVVKKSYFFTKLANSFEHPRNFQASLIKEKSLDTKAKQTILDKAAFFVPFSQLPSWLGGIKELEDNFDNIVKNSLQQIDFDVDGVVFEVVNHNLKTYMGANRKFHRWQIAFKENIDKIAVKVISITPQVGRTGKVTPVAELEPTFLSGATIMRATVHHYGLVNKQSLGSGSIVELIRSGLVIPKINKVLKSTKANIPQHCPSCDGDLVWEDDFLMCVKHDSCPAQIIGKMAYFFKTLANNDGFGIATIEKLYNFNIRKVSQIYELTKDELIAMGFGKKVSSNLINQLVRSRVEQVEDWRFLAAFGVFRLGAGNCENLLKFYELPEVFNLNVEKIIDIDGFADLSAQAIIEGFKVITDEFNLLYAYKFNIESTLLQKNAVQLKHSLVNKQVVFTGKMQNSRDFMKKYAKSIGIKVASSISNKTDFLIIGEKVGQIKIINAKKLGVNIMKEADYLTKIY